MAKVSIDFNRLRVAVNRELVRAGEKAIDKFPEVEKRRIGEDIVEEMKNQIAKGLSPIEGWGKFPAYKWAGKAKEFLSAASSIKGKRQSAKNARSILRSEASRVRKKGYPYTVRNQYPSKKERPVNLYLSGDFLANLLSKPIRAGVLIGFFESKYAKIEEGHRTGGVKGVNDQPQRPIIPIDDETFSRSVLTRVVDTVRKRFQAVYGSK